MVTAVAWGRGSSEAGWFPVVVGVLISSALQSVTDSATLCSPDETGTGQLVRVGRIFVRADLTVRTRKKSTMGATAIVADPEVLA